MTTAQRTFTHRIGYCITCVIPASVLSADPVDQEDTSNLRTDASQDHLSYIQVTRMLEDGVYLAHVAASPDRAPKGYTVLLTEQQLSFALPWDRRLEWEDHLCPQKRCPESILTLLRASAAEVQPLVKLPAASATGTPPPQGVPAAVMAFEARNVQTLEVRADEVQEALGLAPLETVKDTATYVVQKRSYRMQQAFLRAVVDNLMTQLYQGQDRGQALPIQARCALVAHAQRWHRQTRQPVVNAALTFDGQRQHLIWRVTIGVPASTGLAA